MMPMMVLCMCFHIVFAGLEREVVVARNQQSGSTPSCP